MRSPYTGKTGRDSFTERVSLCIDCLYHLIQKHGLTRSQLSFPVCGGSRHCKEPAEFLVMQEPKGFIFLLCQEHAALLAENKSRNIDISVRLLLINIPETLLKINEVKNLQDYLEIHEGIPVKTRCSRSLCKKRPVKHVFSLLGKMYAMCGDCFATMVYRFHVSKNDIEFPGCKHQRCNRDGEFLVYCKTRGKPATFTLCHGHLEYFLQQFSKATKKLIEVVPLKQFPESRSTGFISAAEMIKARNNSNDRKQYSERIALTLSDSLKGK